MAAAYLCICVVLSTVLVLSTSQENQLQYQNQWKNQRIIKDDPLFHTPINYNWPYIQKPNNQPQAQTYPGPDVTKNQHAQNYPSNVNSYVPPLRNNNRANYPPKNVPARRIGKLSMPMAESNHQIFHIPANADMSNMKIIQVNTDFDNSDLPQPVKEIFTRIRATNKVKKPIKDAQNKPNGTPNSNQAKQNYPVIQDYIRPWDNSPNIPNPIGNIPIFKEAGLYVEPSPAPIENKPEQAYNEAPISQTITNVPDVAVTPQAYNTGPSDVYNYPAITTVNGINPALVPVYVPTLAPDVIPELAPEKYNPSANPILYDNTPFTPEAPAKPTVGDDLSSPVILPGDVKSPDSATIPVPGDVPTSLNPLPIWDSSLPLNPIGSYPPSDINKSTNNVDDKHSNPLIPVDNLSTLIPVPTIDTVGDDLSSLVILPSDVKSPNFTEPIIIPNSGIIPVPGNVPTSLNPLPTGDSNPLLNTILNNLTSDINKGANNVDDKHSNPLIPVDNLSTLIPVPTVDTRPVPDNNTGPIPDGIHTDNTSTPQNNKPSDKVQGFQKFLTTLVDLFLKQINLPDDVKHTENKNRSVNDSPTDNKKTPLIDKPSDKIQDTTKALNFLTTLLNLFHGETELADAAKTAGPNVATDNLTNALGGNPENENEDADYDEDDSELNTEVTKNIFPEKVQKDETKQAPLDNKTLIVTKTEGTIASQDINAKQAVLDKEKDKTGQPVTQAKTPNIVDIFGNSEDAATVDPEALDPISLFIQLIQNAFLGISPAKKISEEPNVNILA